MTASALTRDAGANDTTLYVDDRTLSGLADGKKFQLGSEIILVRNVKDGVRAEGSPEDRVQVFRGVDGTTRAAHSADDEFSPSTLPNSSVGKTDLIGGFLKVALADGTASAANVTLADIDVGDELVFVGSFATKASIATMADRTSEYAVGDGVLTKAAGTNETSNQLVIIYLDLT